MSELTEVSINPDLAVMKQNEVSRKARINRPKWNPKKWHPVYEEVVFMDILGMSRTDMAREKGFTEAHITNILNTDHARMIKLLALKKMENKRDETIDQRMERLTLKAMDRVEAVMNDDDVLAKNPLGLFDRAITVLTKAGKIKPDEDAARIGTAIFLTDSQSDRLLKGTELADQARKLHAAVAEVAMEVSPVSK